MVLFDFAFVEDVNEGTNILRDLTARMRDSGVDTPKGDPSRIALFQSVALALLAESLVSEDDQITQQQVAMYSLARDMKGYDCDDARKESWPAQYSGGKPVRFGESGYRKVRLPVGRSVCSSVPKTGFLC